MNDGWNIIIRQDEVSPFLHMWFIKQNQDGSRVTVNPLDMTMTTDLTVGERLPEPTLKFDGYTEIHQFLSGLAGAIIQAGYRPDELKAKEGEMEATKAHLEDMRRIVFEALTPPELPPSLPRS